MTLPTNCMQCQNCDHFDPVLRGQVGRGTPRETGWGWCSKKSIYPTHEGPGQRFPEDVERAEEGELAKPVIVRRQQVVTNCTLYEIRKPRLSKADLIKKMKNV